ncbi:hypothetical protein GF314_16825 [bacterium]|nr:hypothetical protein [bacterium]
MTSRAMIAVVIHGLVVVLAVSHAGAALIACGAFDPALAVAMGLAATAVLAWLARGPLGRTWGGDVGWHDRVGRDLLLLLAVALVFRYAPLPEFAGGRDDGVYSNMAAHLMHASSPRHSDPTLVAVPDDARDVLAAPVHGSVRFDREPARERAGRLEGLYLPGVYIADASSATYVFQFLHVHPVWMAIVGQFAGTARMGHAVVGFSLLSVGAFYLLLLALTGRRGWSLMGGLLLAVNPLHAYFARNSASEPVALFFNLALLLMLVWAWRLATDAGQRRLLAGLAVASFSAFCLTRINGFFLFPFLVVAAVDAVSRIDDGRGRRLVVATLVGFAVVFMLSVMYLWHTSYPYAIEQYRKVFAPLLGERWDGRLPWVLLVSAVLVGVLLAVAARRHGAGRWVQRARPWFGPAASAVMLVGLVVHALKVHQLATGEVADHVGYVARYGLAGLGLQSVKHASLVNVAVYASPLVLGLLVWELLRWGRRGHERSLVLLLLAGYFVYAAVLQWVLPYQFYYGRYLLSAVLPFMLLVVIVGAADGCADRRADGVRRVAVVLALVWCTILSVVQLRFDDDGALLAGLREATADVASRDLLLLDDRVVAATTYTLPLIYTLDHNVWSYGSDEHLRELLDLARDLGGYDRIWVATGPVAPAWFEPVRSVEFHWSHPRHAALMPLTERKQKCRFTLYRVATDRDPAGQALLVARRPAPGVAVRGLHGDGVWTGERLALRFAAPVRDRSTLVIERHGWRPTVSRDDLDHITIVLNGQTLERQSTTDQGSTWSVPPGALVATGNEIVITVPTFVPADVIAGSGDRRELGLDLASIVLR